MHVKNMFETFAYLMFGPIELLTPVPYRIANLHATVIIQPAKTNVIYILAAFFSLIHISLNIVDIFVYIFLVNPFELPY